MNTSAEAPDVAWMKQRWADRYDFELSDTYTKLFVVANNWMDRAEKAEAELAALWACVKAADVMRSAGCMPTRYIAAEDDYDTARAAIAAKAGS